MEVDEKVVSVMVHITHDGCVIDVCYDDDPNSSNYCTIRLAKMPKLSILKQCYPNAKEIEVVDRR